MADISDVCALSVQAGDLRSLSNGTGTPSVASMECRIFRAGLILRSSSWMWPARCCPERHR